MYELLWYQEPVAYKDALEMQQTAFERVKNKECSGVVFILQHKPIYTIGTSGGWQNILQSREFLEREGIDIIEVSRGGNITFHGPGQIIIYPILDLTLLKRDTHWYVQCLEEVIIKVLQKYRISGSRKPEYRGVWVGDKKICAVGVSIKHWITQHGLSFNINVDKKYFGWINPCGITEFGITSLEDYVYDINYEKLILQIKGCLENVLQIKFEECNKVALSE